MSDALTREQVEKIRSKLVQELNDSESKGLLNDLVITDAALRAQSDKYRSDIIDVGQALELIMPERVAFFATEGMTAVKRLRAQLQAQTDKEA